MIAGRVGELVDHFLADLDPVGDLLLADPALHFFDGDRRHGIPLRFGLALERAPSSRHAARTPRKPAQTESSKTVMTSPRDDMKRLYRAPEPEVLKPLLARAALTADLRARVLATAGELIGDLRAAQAKGWVNQFLQQYQLNSAEGIALLSLAEAFLRVPDPATADQLIADKIGEADWRAHTGESNSKLVNAATWGLVVGRALVSEGGGTLKQLISRAGEPFVRTGVGAAMRMMGEIFVMGRTIDEAMKRMKKPENRGFTASFDMLGEAARTHEDAARYFEAYRGGGRCGRARSGGGAFDFGEAVRAAPAL